MNLAAGAPGWALVALLLILVVASIQDAIQLKIANLLSIAVLLLGVLVMVLAGPSAELWQNLVVFAVTLVIGTFLFARGKLGGGDVKMLAATSLWFDFPGALRFVLSVAIAGGATTSFDYGSDGERIRKTSGTDVTVSVRLRPPCLADQDTIQVMAW